MTARVVSLYPPAEPPVDPHMTLAEAQLQLCLTALADVFGEPFAREVERLQHSTAADDIDAIEARFTRHLPGAPLCPTTTA